MSTADWFWSTRLSLRLLTLELSVALSLSILWNPRTLELTHLDALRPKEQSVSVGQPIRHQFRSLMTSGIICFNNYTSINNRKDVYQIAVCISFHLGAALAIFRSTTVTNNCSALVNTLSSARQRLPVVLFSALESLRHFLPLRRAQRDMALGYATKDVQPSSREKKWKKGEPKSRNQILLLTDQ